MSKLKEFTGRHHVKEAAPRDAEGKVKHGHYLKPQSVARRFQKAEPPFQAAPVAEPEPVDDDLGVPVVQ